MTETKEEIRRLLHEPDGPQRLMGRVSELRDRLWELWQEQDAAAAGLLARGARRKEMAAWLNEKLGNRQSLYQALASENFKLRKNAARLAGALGCAADTEKLGQALERETIRMVRPSLILALGAMQCEDARKILAAYTVEPAADADQEAHCRAEQEALRKALGSYETVMQHTFIGFPEGCRLEMTAPEGLTEVLGQEAVKAGFQLEKIRSAGVRVRMTAEAQPDQVRLWHELLIPIGVVPYDPEAVADLCRSRVLPFLKKTHEGMPPFYYRWELRGFSDRAAAARELTQALAMQELVANPSSYEVELRLIRQGTQARLAVKLYTRRDERFAYRKKALPASIHPATAAGLMALAAPWLKDGATVADPCCGSGTLLIERAQRTVCRRIGIDISRQAIEAAKENFQAAGLSGSFLQCDCLRWKPKQPVDEILSNLPFGNRVGTHESNQRLYAGFIKKLPDWLKPGGVAVLYTMEIRLLRQCLEDCKALEVRRIVRTEAGGLTPAIFILQKKGGQSL